MNILAIETATEACSASLSINDVVSKQSQVAPQQHSQLILPMIDSLLQQADLEVSQLDYLAFGRGPGSFTGVRIATGMIQGLSMSANIPVVGVSTLATMAQNALVTNHAQYAVAAIDARMGEVYFGIFKSNAEGVMTLIENEQVLAPKKAIEKLAAFVSSVNEPFFTVGTGWQAYPELLESDEQVKALSRETEILYPDAEFMLPYAKSMIAQNQVLSADKVQPVYVRDEVTWKKLPGR